MSILLGEKEYFPGIGEIKYEGPETDNPLAFRYYDANRVVAGKTMHEHFRFAIAYWHSFCGNGGDPFGGPTHFYEWDKAPDPIQRAKDKADAAFEFITKIGAPYYCFHDLDVVDQVADPLEFDERVRTMTEVLKRKQVDSGVKLLWGTANLFSHYRYMNGASTNPDFAVVAQAGSQIKTALDATIDLGGDGYVFWGGREGYMSLINTNMQREREHFARMLHLAVDHARGRGWKGKFFIEPKPMEPTKHQYDYDCATVIGFLREFDLMNDFGINVEVNHATLAGHTFQHECQVAADAGMLASLDANRGDMQNGWDTDQFPLDLYEWTEAMLILLRTGGLKGGGINFDAKRRRNSTDNADLFHAHVGGMDVIARSLLIADKIRQHGELDGFLKERYASFDSGKGKDFEEGKLTLADLRQVAIDLGQPEQRSGRQEYLENLISRFI